MKRATTVRIKKCGHAHVRGLREMGAVGERGRVWQVCEDCGASRWANDDFGLRRMRWELPHLVMILVRECEARTGIA